MAEIRPVEANNLGSNYIEETKQDISHVDQSGPKGLSDVQQTLATAAEREKAKSLGTFTAIKYYWVAFLWSQFCSFGTVLVGYDGTVSTVAFRGSS
jgi:hypothetical protein